MKLFGFDLGTQKSSVSYFYDGIVSTLSINGQESLPSVVYIDPDDDSRLFGQQVLTQRLIHPERILFDTKTQLGKRTKKLINGENFYPDDVAYELLAFMRRKVKEQFGEDIGKASIALPSYFDENQREFVQRAAMKAGINLFGLVSEAQAAAMDYCFNKRLRQSLMVIDIGSGTFEVAIVDVKHNEIELLASGGDDLGGNDFNLALTDFFKNQMLNQKKVSTVPESEIDHQNLLNIAEKVKIALSASPKVQIAENLAGVKLKIKKFTLGDFEGLLQPILIRITQKISEVLKISRLSLSSIDEILLTGGTCKHPIIQNLIAQNFKTPSLHPNPETCVSRGTAILCHQLTDSTKPHTTSATLTNSIGVEMYDENQERLRLVHVLKRTKKYPVKGALIGATIPGQFRLKLKIWQGEYINELHRNKELGEIKVDLQKEHIGEQNGVVIILQADEGGELKCTTVEIPYNKELINDPTFIQMLEFSDKNLGLIQYTDIYKLMQKYKFQKHELILEI